MPTYKPVTELSNDGYYDDPGALNGSATGEKALTSDNVTIEGESDITYDDTAANEVTGTPAPTTSGTPTPPPTIEPGVNVRYLTLSTTLILIELLRCLL